MHLIWSELGYWVSWVGKPAMLHPLEYYWQEYEFQPDGEGVDVATGM
ncbi:hypothetical protein P0D88_39635 [Paraburkholderia sp. RL18-103-BIB-C]|jgi:hypothetical protein